MNFSQLIKKHSMHSFYIVLVTKIFTSFKKIAFTRPDIEPSLCEHSTAPPPPYNTHIQTQVVYNIALIKAQASLKSWNIYVLKQVQLVYVICICIWASNIISVEIRTSIGIGAQSFNIDRSSH